MAILAEKLIAARFGREDELRCDIVALAAHALLLLFFALLCYGILPPALFMVLGLCAYVRNFNALHEAVHARRSAWNPLRRIYLAAMIVHSPFQLGFSQLARNHRLHHAYPRDRDHDPDALLNSGEWYTAAPYASVQPEFTALQYLRRNGAVDDNLPAIFAYNCAVTALLFALAGTNIVWWIALTRVGSTLTWFLFDWVLHHPRVYSRIEGRPLPAPVRWLWSALFSHSNFNATRFHGLHHTYPGVADNELPALSRALAERATALSVTA